MQESPLLRCMFHTIGPRHLQPSPAPAFKTFQGSRSDVEAKSSLVFNGYAILHSFVELKPETVREAVSK
jgi:hypothetical protein